MNAREGPDVLDRAGDIGRVVFTNDDFLIEASRRQTTGEYFAV